MGVSGAVRVVGFGRQLSTAIGGSDRQCCCSLQTENMKHFEYGVVRERENSASAFRVGSSNWLLTEKYCACAFAIVSLSVEYRHSLLSTLWDVMQVF